MGKIAKSNLENDPDNYFDEGKFQPYLLKQDIINEYDLIYVPQIGFHMFENYWKRIDEELLKVICEDKLDYKVKPVYINQTLELLKGKGVYKPIHEINKNRSRLVLQNGTLDISKWSNPIFYDNQYFKEDFCTIQLNCNYIEDARPNEFLNYLKTTFEEDIERVKIVQEILGYCLTTSTKFEKAFILFGEGSNGKSVLINVLEKLVTNKNITSVGMSDLDKPFLRSSLLNKLVNISSELEDYVKDTGYFKKIVSGDIIDAQFKFKDSFEFRPNCKMVFALNHLPKMKDTSNGMYRRLIIIPFNKTFTKEEQDKNLNQKLTMELDGILQFALRGLKRLEENDGFTESQLADEIMAEYKAESNPVELFLIQTVISSDNGRVVCQELYKLYDQYCKDYGFKPLNNVHFGREVLKKYKKKQTTIDNKREYVYVGIEIA